MGRIEFDKKHVELLRCFRSLVNCGLVGWRYAIIGSTRRSSDSWECQELLRELARGYPVDLLFDLDFSELRSILERAALFWHAKGFGVVDVTRNPEEMEHFGIAPAEAMAAGCVPLVFHGGGLPEIVDHGSNGMLWKDLEELKALTLAVIRDPERRSSMSERARAKASLFSKERFLESFSEITRRVMGLELRTSASGSFPKTIGPGRPEKDRASQSHSCAEP
ncbi:MAG: glycosyltransferase [Isosphaeraceae bacterium]|nr:glycosyltransferase [Isosphaeraceae bacterium]